MSLHEEVEAALSAEPVSAQDRGTAALALVYAQRIDDGADLAKVGPALLAVLEALQMSPRSRNLVKNDDQQPTANPLDTLAERRRARRTAGMDITAP